MPSKSPAQERLMRAVAHGWKKPGGGGPTQAVAKKFVNADRRKKVQSYQFGGVTGPSMYGGATGRMMPGKPQMPGQPGSRRTSPPQMPHRGMQPRRGGLGQARQFMEQGRGMPPKVMPGNRVAPPPGKYPGGGNPMTGGRNPITRQVADRNRPMMGGRGATSYMR